jgi:hypothetical protein
MLANQAAWTAGVWATRSGTLIPKTGPFAAVCVVAEGLEGGAVDVVVVEPGAGVVVVVEWVGVVEWVTAGDCVTAVDCVVAPA